MKLSYVIPCYFNEKNIPITFAELIRTRALFSAGTEFEYIFVNDGSKDKTLDELLKCRDQYPNEVKVINLAANVGSYKAILAGMQYATGDAHVILAADLQDPPDLIPEMKEHWEKGYKLVIANRQDREEDFIRKTVSNTFHWFFKKFALTNLPDGGFDLILFDKALSTVVAQTREANPQIHYLLFALGYPFVSIPYVRRARELGESQWTVSKKIKLMIDSFVGFSYVPIRMISVAGFISAFFCIVYLLVVILHRIFGGPPVQGWSSLMVVLLGVSAFNFLALGVLGEYLWRTLDIVRERPKFVVEREYLPQARRNA